MHEAQDKTRQDKTHIETKGSGMRPALGQLDCAARVTTLQHTAHRMRGSVMAPYKPFKNQPLAIQAVRVRKVNEAGRLVSTEGAMLMYTTSTNVCPARAVLLPSTYCTPVSHGTVRKLKGEAHRSILEYMATCGPST